MDRENRILSIVLPRKENKKFEFREAFLKLCVLLFDIRAKRMFAAGLSFFGKRDGVFDLSIDRLPLEKLFLQTIEMLCDRLRLFGILPKIRCTYFYFEFLYFDRAAVQVKVTSRWRPLFRGDPSVAR